MVLDPRASVEVNVAEIIRLPDGTNFTRGNHGELLELLFGKPEDRDPAKYAEIFRMASGDLSASLWMRFMARSESLNGKRRINGADISAIAGELEVLVIEAGFQLENTREKYILLGGVAYNRAIVERGLRHYAKAAAAQRQSSAWYGLAGDVPKQLTGMFAAQVEDVSVAFVVNNAEMVERSIRALIAARDHIFYTLPEYPGWMQDNASIHIAWALVMAEIGYSLIPTKLFPQTLHGPDYWTDVVAASESRSVEWAQVFQMWRTFYVRPDEFVDQVPTDIQSSSIDNARLSTQIIRALVERRQWNTEAANERLRAVTNHQGPDGGIPIAVAKRLLARNPQ